MLPRLPHVKKKQMQKHLLLFYGAGDEARTRYLHLGKVALYRMSYTRGTREIIAYIPDLSIPGEENFYKSLFIFYSSAGRVSSGSVATVSSVGASGWGCVGSS